MFDKELFEKICNVTCSQDELVGFNLSESEFDLNNPFEKYYDVKKILLAIEKYQCKKVNAIFLASWMNAYNWILMAGFKTKKKANYFTLKDFLVYEISDWLDALSFFDCSEAYDLEWFKAAFIAFDLILRDIQQCSAVFSREEFFFDGETSQRVTTLISNDSSKYFAWFESDILHDDILLFDEVDFDTIDKTAKKLRNFGYKEYDFYFSGYKNDDR